MTSAVLADRLERMVQIEGVTPKIHIYRDASGVWWVAIAELWFLMTGQSRQEVLTKSISALEAERAAVLQEVQDLRDSRGF